MTSRATLLLVSPVFRGYWQAIAEAFRRRGFNVTPYLYDELNALRARAHYKLRFELRGRLGSTSAMTDELSSYLSEKAAQAVRENHPDIIVVIKGDVLNDRFWDEVDDSGAQTVSWFYDELRRMSFTDAGAPALKRRRAIATYSALDADALKSKQRQDLAVVHLPLAFDCHLTYNRQANNEISFIGARYGDREQLLTTLLSAGVPVRAYGRDWSRHPVDKLRTWSLHRPAIPSSRDVDRAHAYGLMAGSTATINVHADQDGFTMRTFEANGVGGLQLVDRSDVSDLYAPGEEILVFHDETELVELAQRAFRDRAWSEKIRAAAQQRTLTEHTFDHRVPILEEMWS